MMPIDPRDIWLLRPQRNADLEKYIIDEYKGDISFLYNRGETADNRLKHPMLIRRFFLYIKGRK
ncbi:MAG: hypothetical protein RE471_03210 [Ferroplasma sp.]|uniref:hypothetical protein n=1 Tax=Ferroplasma sp. TaxID=2591003 RepID=UPI002815A02D|nr:hypothetical protein [Ferroplasma sp.]WMT51896.1 MAG: hypothetical protein RE471_03210 [Ferroplasma sp.]